MPKENVGPDAAPAIANFEKPTRLMGMQFYILCKSGIFLLVISRRKLITYKQGGGYILFRGVGCHLGSVFTQQESILAPLRS